MKVKIDNYTFNKTAKTITFSDYSSIRLDAVLLITNVTDNIIIYNFADTTKGGTVENNVLTLVYDTSSMDNNDKLMIYYDDSDAASLDDVKDEITNKDLMMAIRQLLQVIANPNYVDKSANQMRAQVTGTLSTVTTVTTVSTLTNMSTIDTLQGRLLINNNNLTAWATTVRARIG